ncbi:MAG: DNA replication protein DnaC [Cognaticolwellia sp.]|jgi:DNA replication protein DnaC
MKNVFDSENTVIVNGTCAEHGDWDYRVPPIFAKHSGQCPACAELEKNQQLIDLNAKQSQEKLQRKQDSIRNQFTKAAIPKRYLNRTFDNYNVSSQQQQLALNVSRHYASHFDERLENGGGLILQGKPGTGKTHLACAIANAVITNGGSARFTTVMQLVRAIRATWKRDSEQSESDVLQSIVDYDLLIIDEIGVQYETESEKLILFDVLNGRYENVKPTILLTNLVGEELNACIGERNVDRIQEGGGSTISFTWGSYRANVYQDKALKSESCADVAANKLGAA